MPRDIPVGNGRMLVTFDQHYQIRDFYFPFVGQENHGGLVPCRFGIYTDVPPEGSRATTSHGIDARSRDALAGEEAKLAGTPGPVGAARTDDGKVSPSSVRPKEPARPRPDHWAPKPGGRLAWTTDGFQIRKRYLRDTLTTSVSLEHPELKVALYCNDAVDFHRRVMVRRIKVRNLTDYARNVRLIHHQPWHLSGTNVGNTAYYDPDLKSLVHYRGPRYILSGFFDEAGNPRLDEYATGTSGFGGAEGTWRDAEDGLLQGNPIAQGAVDSCIAHDVHLEPGGEAVCHLVFICGHSREELIELSDWLATHPPQDVLDRTTSYWRLWVSGAQINFGDLPARYVELFKRSLLTVRTQVDETGAILAANDSDILQFSRDTYSYVWPRDGALVADALDAAGFPMLSRRFFEFCQRTITPEGYLHHKYNPDGSVASSWHPWQTRDGKRRLPIQEDETALVVWALWRHFERHRDTEFIRPMWVDVVQPAADFMVDFRDERTGLPHPSWDLWEERWGVHAFTVATVWAGLIAAQKFAVSFGDRARAEKYAKACDEIRAGAEKHLYVGPLGRFVRRLIPREEAQVPPYYDVDEVLDISMWALGHFGMFAPEDERFRKTMTALERRLWVKTPVGGVARYENDYYHRVSPDIAAVPGNPWFICTLWLADDLIARATTPAELRRAMPILDWVAGHALESGVLAEQVDPHTNAPLSVSPLTWSHAQVVSTAMFYLEKLESLNNCTTCRQPLFHVRGRPGDRTDLSPTPHNLETLVASASVPPNPGTQSRPAALGPGSAAAAAAGGALPGATGTLSISTPECIGCGLCVTACSQNVLVSHRGKALIDARKLQACDLDGTCADVCPTHCIRVTRTDTAAA